MNQTIKILPGQRFSRKVIQKTFILLIISWLISGLMIKAQGQIFGKNLPTLKSLHLKGWISSFRMTSYEAIINQDTIQKGKISPDKEVGTPLRITFLIPRANCSSKETTQKTRPCYQNPFLNITIVR